MRRTQFVVFTLLVWGMAAWVQPVFGCEDKDLTALEMLGKHIFFDPISVLLEERMTCAPSGAGFSLKTACLFSRNRPFWR